MIDPILDHQERVFRFSSNNLIPACHNLYLLLVFPSHVEPRIYEDSPSEVVGENHFLKLDGIWVVASDKGLLELVEGLYKKQGGH